MVMPLDCILIELPFESLISIEPGPSARFTLLPPGVSSVSVSLPSVSSNVSFTPLRERSTFL